MTGISEKELRDILDYLEDVTDNDKIEIAKYCVASKLEIKDDDFAIRAFDELIKPFLEDDIKRELIMLRAN